MDNKKKNILIGIGIYLISAIVAFFLFSKVNSGGGLGGPTAVAPTQVGSDQRVVFNSNLPKTQACPINGVKYSNQQEAWWQKHRPLGVMIENHTDARPQSGMTYADAVYEAVAEGGITRFLNIFYCQDAGIVGPVRSARTYFVDFVSEYADYPLYAHVGGANTSGPADALGQISSYGWDAYNDLNQFSIGFPTYWRDYERAGHQVATEHTMYSTTDKLWAIGQQRKLTNVDKDGNSWNANFVPYKFQDASSASQRGKSQVVSFNFWNNQPDYAVKWTYNPATNLYMRENGGTPHIDRDTGKQLSTTNLIILFMNESTADDGYEGNVHQLFVDKGTGKASIFIEGKETQGTWTKKSRTDRTIIKDASGKEVTFDRGKMWFEIIDTATPVSVK